MQHRGKYFKKQHVQQIFSNFQSNLNIITEQICFFVFTSKSILHKKNHYDKGLVSTERNTNRRFLKCFRLRTPQFLQRLNITLILQVYNYIKNLMSSISFADHCKNFTQLILTVICPTNTFLYVFMQKIMTRVNAV